MDDRHFASSGTIGLAAALLLTSVILMVTPLNLFGGLIGMPLLPLIVIFLYGLDRSASLPPWLTFAAGLLLDLLFGGAVGPWASVFLLLHAAITWQRGYFSGRDGTVLTTGFAISMFGVLMVYWCEMSILGGRAMPLGPLFGQGLLTVAVFPLALKIFRRSVGRQRPTLGG